MKPSYDAKHFSNLTSCNRRTVLRGIAGSLTPPALIASTDAFANATRGVTLAAAESGSTQHELTHRSVSVNGLRLHIAESGQGPLVLLCHGFPECWYSWRHQLRALAEAGFHAVAPDMRGFGQTDAPEEIAEYTIDSAKRTPLRKLRSTRSATTLRIWCNWCQYSEKNRRSLSAMIGARRLLGLPRCCGPTFSARLLR